MNNVRNVLRNNRRERNQICLVVKITPASVRFADDAEVVTRFEIQPIPTRYAIENWNRVRGYVALLKLYLPCYFRRYRVTEQQIILLHV